MMTDDFFVIRVTDTDGRHDTVHVGPYPTGSDAQRMADSIEAELATDGDVDCYVEHVFTSLERALYRHREGHNREDACDECREYVPTTGGLVSSRHARSCSLHPSNVAP